MTSNPPDLSEEQTVPSPAETSSNVSEQGPPLTSATTKDHPSFGWSAYAERVNGRFAMIGFTAILIISTCAKNNAFLSFNK